MPDHTHPGFTPALDSIRYEHRSRQHRQRVLKLKGMLEVEHQPIDEPTVFPKSHFLSRQHPSSVPEFFPSDIQNLANEVNTYEPPFSLETHLKKNARRKVIGHINHIGQKYGMR